MKKKTTKKRKDFLPLLGGERSTLAVGRQRLSCAAENGRERFVFFSSRGLPERREQKRCIFCATSQDPPTFFDPASPLALAPARALFHALSFLRARRTKRVHEVRTTGRSKFTDVGEKRTNDVYV